MNRMNHYPHRGTAQGQRSEPGHASGWLRLFLTAFLILLVGAGAVGRGAPRGYAQSVAPQSDEFNAPTFAAPFQVVCAAAAHPPCPDGAGPDTWNLDENGSGQLQIVTQPGTIVGTGSTATNNARNLVVEPFNPSTDWTATTRMTFNAPPSATTRVGQSAGLLVYQNDDNFIFFGRTYSSATASQVQFTQESGGQTATTTLTESAPDIIYLRLVKTGDLYQASFSYDNQNFTAVPPASTGTGPTSPNGYLASYPSPRVGLAAFGGPNAQAPALTANFDWFHVVVSNQPTSTATATSPTNTPTPTTNTPTPTATPTSVPTATDVPAPAPAALALSPTSGQPGSTIIVGGSSFQPGERVKVRASFPLYNGNTLTETRNTVAGSTGAINPVSLTIPNGAKQGSASVQATGSTSKRTGRATLSVVYHPTISATGVVPPGGQVNVSGRGFVANSRVAVSVTTTNANGTTNTRTATATTDGAGTFQTSITLPTTTRAGTYSVTAADTAGSIRASTHVMVALHPTIALASPSVLPGHNVTVSGGGYSAHAPVTVTATFPLYGGGSQTVTTRATTSSTGTFSAHLKAPARAAAGTVLVTAQGPNGRSQTGLIVRALAPQISVSPAVILPGSTAQVRGSGYLPGSKVDITIPVTHTGGSTSTLSATAVTNAQGAFSAQIPVPGDVQGGTYNVQARGESSGRTAKARLAVTQLSPSIVVAPTTAAPGTKATVTGFGFAPGASLTISLTGHALGTATVNSAGRFSLSVTIPKNVATGSYTLTAVSNNGRQATAKIAVNRSVATHFYFAALYTGHQEYLALFNPSAIRATVTITYQLTTGATRVKQLTIAPHTRFTENVNADLGPRVSTAASVAADVRIVAERIAARGSDGVVVPGSSAPATSWYFADGNTSHNYTEYIAIQNPGTQPVQAAVHILPTHHAAFTVYRTVRPTSRLTLKINKFVRDAVGVVVNSNAPVVANRTIRIHHGITSKIGAMSPKTTWYFAAGPQNEQARHWIAVTNPSGRSVYLTLHAYSPSGAEVGTVKQWLKPNARMGYLMNRIAGRTDVAVLVAASGPIVAEQTTYGDRNHDASTNAFGTTTPATSWAFAAANTQAGQADALNLFNPNLTALPIVVQFMDTAGHTVQRTYVVGPMAHVRVDVGSVVPNAQLGIMATSNAPFVALNRYQFNNGLAAGTSSGISENGR